MSPVGAAQPQSKCPNTHAVSAAPKGALNFCVPYLPRVSYRALPSFPPWAMQECRAYGTCNAPEF